MASLKLTINNQAHTLDEEKYDKTKPDGTMLEGTNEQKYEIPNLNTRYVHADIHIPLTYWCSVTSSTLAFAHGCFLDEMAYKVGQDTLTFRLAMLRKIPMPGLY